MQQRDVVSYEQPLTSQVRITTRHLCENNLRHKHVVLRPTSRPPFTGKFLIPKHDYVATESADKIADHTRLEVYARLHASNVADSGATGKSLDDKQGATRTRHSCVACSGRDASRCDRSFGPGSRCLAIGRI